MAKPPAHLSPSSWNLFDECPRKWARRYLSGIFDPVGPDAHIGTFHHDVSAHVYELPPAQRTIAEANEIAGALWSDGRVIDSIVNGEIDERTFKQRAWRAVLGLWDVEDPAEVDVVAVEHEMNWTEGGVTFKVKADRIDRGADLGPGLSTIDLKSGKIPAKKYAEPHHRQVVIGAMGVAATMAEGTADRGALLYTTHSEAIPVDTSLKARTETLRAAQETWENIHATCAEVDAIGGSWLDVKGNVGPLCGFCPAAAQCDVGTAYIRRAWSSNWKSFYPDQPATQAVIALHPEMAPAEAF